MSQNSAIEWTEATWNCLAGCTEISPGCLHCYAAIMAHRLGAMAEAEIAKGIDPGGKRKYLGTTKKLPSGKIAWTGKVNPDEEALLIPLQKKAPTTYFVNSMSDLFHEDVPDEFIDRVFAVMALSYQHTYQVLTKRADRLQSYLLAPGVEDRIDDIACDMREQVKHWQDFSVDYIRLGRGGFVEMPLDNVWLGVSVENKQHGLPRIEHLLRTPAAVRFLSIEPLLEDLGDIRGLIGYAKYAGNVAGQCVNIDGETWHGAYERCGTCGWGYHNDPDNPGRAGIGWVIVGGESGHGARPMIMDWAASIIIQCKTAGVPVFMKQVGSNPFINKDLSAKGISSSQWGPIKDSKGGVMEEWPEHLRVREMPRVKEGVTA